MSSRISLRGLRRLIWVDTLRRVHNVNSAQMGYCTTVLLPCEQGIKSIENMKLSFRGFCLKSSYIVSSLRNRTFKFSRFKINCKSIYAHTDLYLHCKTLFESRKVCFPLMLLISLVYYAAFNHFWLGDVRPSPPPL